ncbi:hypothetical protein CANMA_002158 [Candida margitis]|uniref:uncharacterized protein n=1 Tax=Candida margitis TaxID=1775924 RepID=UPI0022274339|nr:uncharacterized protein CANMA_002158 [Candida margitis]KAI5968722.1 hypothetical protein CANMA_002158 [Candida margitis]
MLYDASYSEELQVKDSITTSFMIGSFAGFAGEFTEKVLERLSRCPLVDEISQDIEVYSFTTNYQMLAPRHLARLSRRRRMLPILKYPFVYNSEFAGKKVNAYVIDSGIYIGHPEFQGRARTGRDFSNEGEGDNNGHGTHVAGLIGAKSYGAAKNVEIFDVKALNSVGTGTLSTIISAIEFAVNHRLRSGRPGVANLSFGAHQNAILNSAIEQATRTGLVFVVAAGNSNIDACLMSPASSTYAITVGAIDDHGDSIAGFSNWGSCVDIFASGSNVRSVDFKNIYKSSILSGTSMASPIVAGVVATILSEGVDPAHVRDRLNEIATLDRISRTSLYFRPNTPNRIAYVEVEESFSKADKDNDSDSKDELESYQNPVEP